MCRFVVSGGSKLRPCARDWLGRYTPVATCATRRDRNGTEQTPPWVFGCESILSLCALLSGGGERMAPILRAVTRVAGSFITLPCFCVVEVIRARGRAATGVIHERVFGVAGRIQFHLRRARGCDEKWSSRCRSSCVVRRCCRGFLLLSCVRARTLHGGCKL